MVAFNFKKEFSDKILSGEKRSTIRQIKRCSVGDKMQLYTGQRTKQCRKLADAICIGTAFIAIRKQDYYFLKKDGDVLVSNFATQEGFDTLSDLYSFFEKHYGFPFEGYIHTWEITK